MRSIGSAATLRGDVAERAAQDALVGPARAHDHGDRAVGAVERRQLVRRSARCAWIARWMASVAPVAAKAGKRLARRHGARRGRACGSARRSAPPPARSARGRARPRPRRRPARRASACRGCRAARAGGAARRARCRPRDRRNAAAPRRGRRRAPRRTRPRSRRATSARCRRCARPAGNARAARAARSSRHRGRPGSARCRSRPRTVMRSAAPGPAPMKCTVMASSPVSARAQVAGPTAMRGAEQPRCGAAGRERRRLGDRRHAGERDDTLGAGGSAMRRRLRDRSAQPESSGTPSADAAAAMPGSPPFDGGRGDDVERVACEPGCARARP